MGLQTDAEGNFYYAKAARHGLPAVVPHHGTLLRVSKDGTHTEILATGFRAPNGVCLNPDGTFFLSDQEGFWTPKNRINWVKRGGFYGNMWGYHDVTDSSDARWSRRSAGSPMPWIAHLRNSLWVESEQTAWKPLQGSLLSLSYGNGKIFVVPHESRGRPNAGWGVRIADPRVPDWSHAGAVQPGRRPALHLRTVWLGR